VRALFASWAWPSHYFPLVPFGWAMRSAGHETVVASQPALVPAIVGSGLPAVAVGTDLDFEALMRGPMDGVPPADASRAYWREMAARKAVEAVDTFVFLADNMHDDLLAFARHWKPDVIVHDTTTFAAPMVAAQIGVPAVRHTWGPDLMARFAGLDDLLAPMLDRHGLTPADLTAATTVDPCPPSMQIESPLPRSPMRYTPYNGPARVPDWTWREPRRPLRICVTCGTTSGKLGGEERPLPARVVEALGDVLAGGDAEVLLAVSPREQAQLGPLPDGVRVHPMLPLHVVLPDCDLLVQRGGGATTMTALTYAVPQLVVPSLPDHAFNARQFACTGAGRMLLDGELTDDALRAAVGDLLADATYAKQAAAVRDEMAAQPATDTVVRQVAEIAARGR
jgi:UDP:flavonoid glycosyltransferase YjiC (YdhE family)